MPVCDDDAGVGKRNFYNILIITSCLQQEVRNFGNYVNFMGLIPTGNYELT